MKYQKLVNAKLDEKTEQKLKEIMKALDIFNQSAVLRLAIKRLHLEVKSYPNKDLVEYLRSLNEQR